MPQLPRALSLAALTLALTLGPVSNPAALADGTSVPAQTLVTTQAEDIQSSTVLASEHTDAISMALVDGKLDMFTYADLPGAPRTRLEADQTIFNLQDREETRRPLPAGFDFIGAEGQTIWLAPQTQEQGVLWPGWNTEDIRPGSLEGDSLTLELTDVKAPEGGAVEVFQDSPFGTSRIFSSKDELAPLTQAVGSHVHANWAFTALGEYRLTFTATATLADGSTVSAQQDYTFIVGPMPQDEAEQPPREREEPPVTTPTAEPAPSQPVTPAPDQPAPQPSSPEAPQPAPAEPEDPQAPVQVEQAPDEANPHQPQTPRSDDRAQGDQQPAPPQPGRGTGKGGSRREAPHQVASQAPGSQPSQQCLASEELIEAGKEAQQANRASGPTLNRRSLSIHRAVNSSAEKVTSGHFDFGPVLKGGQLSALVKDDRTAPARWKQAQSLAFILGESARATMPAGMEHIAPAGQEVYLIGATQQPDVPWLGWNTQHPDLVSQSLGPSTLTLTSLTGPGKLSVFLSGNFGASGTTVFNGVGDSFEVPANTHQHGNWVFTAPGTYTATLRWDTPLKDGSRLSSEGSLTFLVGDASAQKDPGAADTPQEAAAPKAEKPKAGVDTESGIVTKPDGSRVRIVGKTADGQPCDLSPEDLKAAQQASARGEQLAYTGSSNTALILAYSAALALGGLGLVIAGRRRRLR